MSHAPTRQRLRGPDDPATSKWELRGRGRGDLAHLDIHDPELGLPIFWARPSGWCRDALEAAVDDPDGARGAAGTFRVAKGGLLAGSSSDFHKPKATGATQGEPETAAL